MLEKFKGKKPTITMTGVLATQIFYLGHFITSREFVESHYKKLFVQAKKKQLEKIKGKKYNLFQFIGEAVLE